MEGAITVGATERGDQRACYSNKGSCLDLFAPGSAITSAWHTADDAQNSISGMSMATPHVAGAVAVYLSAQLKAPRGGSRAWRTSRPGSRAPRSPARWGTQARDRPTSC